VAAIRCGDRNTGEPRDLRLEIFQNRLSYFMIPRDGVKLLMKIGAKKCRSTRIGSHVDSHVGKQSGSEPFEPVVTP
jgi:hypothetical protein